jgi:hypothetical protein
MCREVGKKRQSRRKTRWDERTRFGGRRRGGTHKEHMARRESGGCERHGLPEEIDPVPIASAMDLLNYCLVTFIEREIFLQVKEERYS